MMQLTVCLKSMLCGALLAVTVFSGGLWAESNATLTMTATIPQTACTVSLTPASPLDLGDVDSSKMTTRSISSEQKVTLKLTKCGLGNSDTTPQVTLTGLHPAKGKDVGDGDINYLFRDDTASTSRNYFIVIANKSSPAYTGSDVYKEGDGVYSGSKGESGSGVSKDVYIGATCATVCAKALSGSLQATLTFTFAYK